MGRGMDTWNTDYRARHGLPPTLIREGERVQPDWLFRFLRHPTIIRPQFSRQGAIEKGMMVLRMPRFNMSDEDAQAIVNYFAAVDKTTNTGIGLQYPYSMIPQRDEGYFKEHAAQYLAKLKKEKGLEPRPVEAARPSIADVGAHLRGPHALLAPTLGAREEVPV